MRRLSTAAIALALAACAAPAPAPSRRAVRASVEPSLASIFADNSLDGKRPTDLAISGDGKYVSYRLTSPRPETAESRASEARSRLYVVSTAGGTQLNLGETGPAVWCMRGKASAMLWCSGKDVKIWTPGTAEDSATVVATLEKTVSNPRVTSIPWIVTVQSGERTWVFDAGAAAEGRQEGMLTKLEYAEGFTFDRWISAARPHVALLRKRADRSESAPASSLPASAPESAPESGPQSRPTGVRYALQSWTQAGIDAGIWEFEVPRGSDLDSVVAEAGAEQALVVLRDGERSRRSGMVADYLTTRVSTRPARGANAGDPEPKRSLWLARKGTEELLPLTGLSEPRRGRFEAVACEAGPAFLSAFTEEDRRGRSIHAVHVGIGAGTETAVVKLLEVPGPVGGVESMALEQGMPVVLSEGSGRARAYSLDNTGMLRAFTPAGVDVHWLRSANPNVNAERATREGIALVCDPSSPEERGLWRVARSGETAAPLPVKGMFVSSPTLSADGSTVAFLGSTLGSVDDVYVMPTDGSAPPKRLTFSAPDPKTYPGGEVPLRIVAYPALDGTQLWAMVYEPPPGVQRNGAAVIFLHGAGYLQQVRAGTGNPNYAANHHFHRRLARLGYVVLAPDFRGSAGYGRTFRTDVYQNLGIPDSDDIVASKRWLVGNCGVDGTRVGLYGGSYGGFLTLMCLFRYPLEFGAGAALRSVTDWRAYSPEYTRPLLGGGPNDVPEVYKRCSPIDHADQLARPLLLLHGLMDDNVFAQDTLRLVEALQKAGKTDLFELMLYPSQNHAFTSSHSWVDEYQRIESFFEEHLAEARRE